MRTLKSIAFGTLLAVALGGCATQAKDPLESLNRGIYKFNDTIDKAAVKPIAGTYKAVLPAPVRSGVNNFFTNLGTVVTVINELLQGKFSNAMDDAGRFVINSTFGIAGVIDVASMDSIEKHREDFGQTLGYWGVGDGPYLVLPLLGPSSFRDTAGLAVDILAFDPIYYIEDSATRNELLLVKFIDRRAQYLPGSDLLDEAALDPYIFTRDAYFQRRHSMIHDGNLPADERPHEESDEESGNKIVAEAPQTVR